MDTRSRKGNGRRRRILRLVTGCLVGTFLAVSCTSGDDVAETTSTLGTTSSTNTSSSTTSTTTSAAPTTSVQVADPGEAAAVFEDGVVMLRSGQVEEAIAAFTEVIELEPGDVELLLMAYGGRSVAHHFLGRFEEAAADATAAVDLGSSDDDWLRRHL